MYATSIRAADGTVLTEQRVQATSGTGTRGTFQALVPLSVSPEYEGTTGSVFFYEPSPKDGSRTNVITIPVVLTHTQSGVNAGNR